MTDRLFSSQILSIFEGISPSGAWGKSHGVSKVIVGKGDRDLRDRPSQLSPLIAVSQRGSPTKMMDTGLRTGLIQPKELFDNLNTYRSVLLKSLLLM